MGGPVHTDGYWRLSYVGRRSSSLRHQEQRPLCGRLPATNQTAPLEIQDRSYGVNGVPRYKPISNTKPFPSWRWLGVEIYLFHYPQNSATPTGNARNHRTYRPPKPQATAGKYQNPCKVQVGPQRSPATRNPGLPLWHHLPPLHFIFSRFIFYIKARPAKGPTSHTGQYWRIKLRRTASAPGEAATPTGNARKTTIPTARQSHRRRRENTTIPKSLETSSSDPLAQPRPSKPRTAPTAPLA
jgi:hypothetical protein